MWLFDRIPKMLAVYLFGKKCYLSYIIRTKKQGTIVLTVTPVK